MPSEKTFMVKHLELDALFFILLGAIVGFFLLINSERTHNQKVFQNFQTIPITFTHPTPTLAPSPTPEFIPTVTNQSQISSDGTKKVLLKITSNKNNTQTFELSTSDSGPIIYSETLAPGESITLPFNAWSPNDRFFFIQENLSTGTHVRVFTATGDTFADGEKNLDLTGVFAAHSGGVIFDEATGWAADNLIVINTKMQNDSRGPSYWFEVPDQAVIYLSTKF